MNEPYKILLVDDEAEVRTSIIRKIDWSAVGFQVVGDAENGVDALEKIEQLEPDVVLTDIRMPYMDGLEMAERLREIHPSIKVVLFSGFDDFEYAQKAIKLNIIEYILKPVNAEEMMEILLRIKGTLDEEIQRLRDLTNLQESFRKNLPILREKFLSVARQFFCETRTEFLRKNSPVLRSKSETRSLASTAPKMEGAAHVKGRVLAWGGAAFAAPPLAFCPCGSSYSSVASPASSAASWAATGSVYSDQP